MLTSGLKIKFSDVAPLGVASLLIMITLTLLLHETSNKIEGNDHNIYALNKTSYSDFSFAAAGDWGCTAQTKMVVDNIVNKNPQLVLGLGDNSYSKSAACWFQLIEPISEKMKIVIGNHDHLRYVHATEYYPSPERLQEYMNYFNLSRQFYSFSHQNVHFIAMSTEVPYEKGSKQYNFVKSDLQKTKSEPAIDWIVVFYHRVAYTSPGLVDEISELRDTYHPLFEDYGVDLVIQAHIHNYQRTYPIEFNKEDSSKPHITDKDKTNYHNPDGQIYAIVGTGGASTIHNFTGPAARYTAVQFNAFGFLNINVLRNGTVMEGNFYENNGTIKDHFTIVKIKKENKETDSSSSLIPLSSPSPSSNSTSRSSSASASSAIWGPKLENGYDTKFRIETVINGLRSPTDIAFLGPRDIIVLDKSNGTVQRIVDGKILGQPLLDVSVANKVERGMLGTAILNTDNNSTYVLLYYTESNSDGSDICPKPDRCNSDTDPIGNRLYRYELTKDSTKLTNPKLLLDLPATPGPVHNGGKMVVDANKNTFLLIGDIMAEGSKTQNYESGKKPTGAGGILKISPDGQQSDNDVLGSKYPLNLYYAYGIRNGFGLDIDPITGNVWDTENGPEFGDEINLVAPGFNSGWKDVQGIWNHKGGKAQKDSLNLEGLEDFDGKGKYSEPEFTWKDTVGPTGIKFFNSDKMGPEFKDSMFVGDVHNGNIYHFNLNGDRTSLLLNEILADKVADTPMELGKIIFGRGFGGITDLEVGPDGYLYVLSIGQGAIYRIIPK